jgi:hypothetical protein
MDNMNLNKNLKIEKLFEDQNSKNNLSSTNYDEYFANELQKYQVSQDEFKEYFHPLFFDTTEQASKALKNNALKTLKTIKQMKEMKKKIDSVIMQRRNADNNSMTEQQIEDE